MKTASNADRILTIPGEARLALASFHARVFLIDHIKAATATHHLAVAITCFQRLKRACNFHVRFHCPLPSDILRRVFLILGTGAEAITSLGEGQWPNSAFFQSAVGIAVTLNAVNILNDRITDNLFDALGLLALDFSDRHKGHVIQH